MTTPDLPGRITGSFARLVLIPIFCLMFSSTSLAQNCSSPPTGSYGPAWAKQYQAWCEGCGGVFSMSGGNPSCSPGANWGKGRAPSGVSSGMGGAAYQLGHQLGQEIGKSLFGDPQEAQNRTLQDQQMMQSLDEMSRQRIHSEDVMLRNAADQARRLDDQHRDETLSTLTGIPRTDGLTLKPSTDFFGIPGNPKVDASDLQLKPYDAALLNAKPDTANASVIARNEQDEFDRMNAAWLRKQQELIRQSVEADKKWKNEVLASIKEIRVPSPIFRPTALKDLRPGDILLIAPDNSLTSQAIVRADPFYRAIDYYFGGDVSKPEFKKGPVSHAMTYVKTVNGEMLFLDHTHEGSRILNTEEFIKKYGSREMYIALPQAKVDGRELWETSREAALKRKSDYGVRGANVVCSERAAIAVAKATALPLQEEHHILGKVLPGIDITPNDFFDDKHAGKYFLISASPILPSNR
jgi:hypothetical protein